jgi:hypothetical protein
MSQMSGGVDSLETLDKVARLSNARSMDKRDFSVRGILAGQATKDAPVTVKGWVLTRRDSKAGISFVHLSDGPSFLPVQVVAPNTLPNYTDEVLKLTAGCAVEATGTIVPSPAKGQSFEMQASTIQVVGSVEEPHTYPIQPKLETDAPIEDDVPEIEDIGSNPAPSRPMDDLTCRLSERATADGGTVDVVDVLPIQLNNLRRKLAAEAPVRLLEMDSTKLDVQDASYNRVLVLFLLHEQPARNRERTLSEVCRVVKPGGKILIIDYALPDRRARDQAWSAMADSCHLSRLGPW